VVAAAAVRRESEDQNDRYAAAEEAVSLRRPLVAAGRADNRIGGESLLERITSVRPKAFLVYAAWFQISVNSGLLLYTRIHFLLKVK
jgi:hypothetical protein